MCLLERALIKIDAFPLGALLRAAIGWAAVPAFRFVLRPGISDWRLLPWFVAVLIGVRIVPAMVRAVVPFPPTATAIWTERRVLAKRFDSYQWRKLVWFGVGLSAYALVNHEFDVPVIALDAGLTVAGCLGQLAWRRSRARFAVAER